VDELRGHLEVGSAPVGSTSRSRLRGPPPAEVPVVDEIARTPWATQIGCVSPSYSVRCRLNRNPLKKVQRRVLRSFSARDQTVVIEQTGIDVLRTPGSAQEIANDRAAREQPEQPAAHGGR